MYLVLTAEAIHFGAFVAPPLCKLELSLGWLCSRFVTDGGESGHMRQDLSISAIGVAPPEVWILGQICFRDLVIVSD